MSWAVDAYALFFSVAGETMHATIDDQQTCQGRNDAEFFIFLDHAVSYIFFAKIQNQLSIFTEPPEYFRPTASIDKRTIVSSYGFIHIQIFERSF